MSTLAVRKGVLTWPGGTGNFTTNITAGGSWPAGTVVKALILCMTYDTADGIVNGKGSITIGLGTFRGGAVQQTYDTTFTEDATVASQNVNGGGSAAILRGVISNTTTADFEMRLVSLGTDQFVLNAFDLPATAGIKIHYIALGGDAITDAYAYWTSTAVTVGATSTAFSLPAGFGQPDLVLFPSHNWTSAALVAQDGRIGFGAAKSATERRHALWGEDDGAATVGLAAWLKDRAWLGYSATTGAIDTEGDVDLSTPTNGFTMNWSDPPGFIWVMSALALKGDFTATITSGVSPATGQSLAQSIPLASGTPKGAIVWGCSVPNASGAVDTTSAPLGAFLFGAVDGSGNEGYGGMHQDDAGADASAGRSWSTAKTYASYDPAGTAAPAMVQDCDGTFSGPDLMLTWDATIATAREYNVLILGEPADGTTPAELSGTTAGIGAATGALTAPALIAGTVAGVGALTGGLSATSLIAGTLASVGFVSGTLTIRPPPQVLVPSADSVDGAWTDDTGGTALAAAIDELAAPNDADYARSELGPALSSARVKLAAGNDPVASDGHLIRWRVGKDTTGGPQVDVRVQLRQGGGNSVGGGTLIAEFTRTDVDALTTFEENLAEAEADAITDYADLYLELRADQP